MHLILLTCLMLFANLAFAIGDSIATVEGGLAFAIAIGIFLLLCVAAIIYFCLKIAGHNQRLKWALLGGLPSIVCAILFSWKIAIVIAFGVAFWLQHTAELKQRNSENIDDDN
jgi:NADH:ubiquinone oxidoreductase subunit H